MLMRYWLYSGDGTTYGPYTIEELKDFAADGRVHAECRLCLEGSSHWLPASSVLSVALPVSPALPAPPAPPAPPDFTGLPPDPRGALEGEVIFLNISVGRLVGMIAVSYGLYAPYWIYRNWRFVKERTQEHMWPFWRGIFGIFWIYPLLVKVRDSAKGRERDVGSLSAGALAVGFIVCSVLASLGSLNERPSIAFLAALLGFAGYCFLIPAQIHVNRLHACLGVNAPPYPFSAGHVVCVILGLIFWFMSMSSLFGRRGWY